jgi:hypothetical protein
MKGSGTAMKKTMIVVGLVAFLGLSQAQQPQIPTLQVCNPSQVSGGGDAQINSRIPSGIFSLRLEVKCNPNSSPYATGSLTLKIDMSDSVIGSIIISPNSPKTGFDQLTTTGKHSPTAYMTGRCQADTSPAIKGCRIWLMVADNGQDQAGTPDVVGFLVFDGAGIRKAYGTAALKSGDIRVSPTSF